MVTNTNLLTFPSARTPGPHRAAGVCTAGESTALTLREGVQLWLLAAECVKWACGSSLEPVVKVKAFSSNCTNCKAQNHCAPQRQT